MAIYKYTFKKYLKSYSTWIIIGLTMLLIILLGGYLPFKTFAPKNAKEYAKLSLILIPTITIFLSIFSSVFSGFKSANMFKDEVEDGTFLIMISKPIPRIKILISKWFALQTLLILYSIITSATLAITILVFDNGNLIFDFHFFSGLKTLKESAWIIFVFVSFILYVMSLIFSSIAILISTKFSVSTTVGFSIAMGIIIFVTPLIRRFSEKQEQIAITNDSPFTSINKSLSRILNDDAINKIIDNLDIDNFDIDNFNIKKLNIEKFIEKRGDHSLTLRENIQKIIDEHKGSNQNAIYSPQSIYNISFSTLEKNTFKNIWFLDTYFQINMLSSFVYDEIVPKWVQKSLGKSINTYDKIRKQNILESPIKNDKIISEDEIDKNLDLKNKINQLIAKFDKYIEFSWQKTKKIRSDYLKLWLILLYNNKSEVLKEINKNTNSLIRQAIGKKSNEFMKLSINDTSYKEGFKLDNNFFKNVYQVIDQLDKSLAQKDNNLVKKVYRLHELMYELSILKWKDVETNKSLFKNNFFISINKWAWKMLSPVSIYNQQWSTYSWLKDHNLSNWNEKKYHKNSTPLLKSGAPDFSKGDIPYTKLYNHTLLNNWNFKHFWKGNGYAMSNRLIHAGLQFNRVQEKEYISKYSILIIFTTVAIVLVPIAYLAIRKKDFR